MIDKELLDAICKITGLPLVIATFDSPYHRDTTQEERAKFEKVISELFSPLYETVLREGSDND